MLDDTLPLTPPEWPEWGNPIESEKDFRTILSYSPYDNVAAKEYPAILAMGGLTDPRVTYWEPAKWIARLRATMVVGLSSDSDSDSAGSSSGRPPAIRMPRLTSSTRDLKCMTETNRTQRALQQQIEERRRVFETSQDLILVTNARGILVQVSPSSAAILGYSPEEMLGRSALDFTHDGPRTALLGLAAQMEQPGLHRLHARDGRSQY